MKHILFFTGDGCANCAAIKPEFERICTEHGFSDYEYIDLYEREDADELAGKYHFRGLPTMVYLDDSGFTTRTGNNAHEYLVEFLNK